MTTKNLEEIPPSMDKLLFAEDLISHFMNKLVYWKCPYGSINVAPRSEKYRKYVYNGFDDNLRKAVDVIYRLQSEKVTQYFKVIAESNVVNSQSFDEYEASLKKILLSDGVDAEDFLKYCVKIAAMTKHFYKCRHSDVPDRAFDFIVKSIPGEEMADVSWDILNRVARRIVRDQKNDLSSLDNSSPDNDSQDRSKCFCFEGEIKGKNFFTIYRIRDQKIEYHKRTCLSWTSEPEESDCLVTEPGTPPLLPSPEKSNPEFSNLISRGMAEYLTENFIYDPIFALEAFSEYERQNVLSSVSGMRNPELELPPDVNSNIHVGDHRQSTSELPDASYQNLLKSYKEKSASEDWKLFPLPGVITSGMEDEFRIAKFVYDIKPEVGDYGEYGSRPSSSSQLRIRDLDQPPKAEVDNLLKRDKGELSSWGHSDLSDVSPKSPTEETELNFQDHCSYRLEIFRREIQKFFESENTVILKTKSNLSPIKEADENVNMNYEIPNVDYELLFTNLTDSYLLENVSELGEFAEALDQQSTNKKTEAGIGEPDIKQEVSNMPISDVVATASNDPEVGDQKIADIPLPDDSVYSTPKANRKSKSPSSSP